jgi:hypothetical protein
MRTLIALATLLVSVTASAGEPNVVLVTLDGVRWQDVFHGSDPLLDRGQRVPVILPTLMQSLLPQGVLFGDVLSNTGMEISNPDAISLPAYHSLMSGLTTTCHTNSCGRMPHETLPERLVRELALPRLKVATISSWTEIALAAESVQGRTFVNSGIVPLVDGTQDPALAALNRLQADQPPPWGAARADAHTIAQAMRYLRVHQPRFLYISLNDTDEHGHRADYPSYVSTVQSHDRWLGQLASQLDSMGDYGRDTTLIVTTDHGRGLGPQWQNHGSSVVGARQIWLYARSPLTRAARQTPRQGYQHIDIRPTIEAAMGLAPLTGAGRGRVIREIVAP